MKINDRVRELRLKHDLTQKEFAELLDITQGNLSLIESHKANISLEILIALHKRYNLSYDWLIDGREVFRNTDRLIPLIEKSAMAGYPANHNKKDYQDKLSLYKIPGFDDGGEYKIFEIEGESMLPTLLPHDFVVAVRVEDYTKIVDGSLAIVVTKDEVMAKRLYLINKTHIKFVSDNSKYDAIIYKITDIQEIWGMQAKITQSFMASDPLTRTEIENLQSELNELKEEMDRIKKRLD